MFLSNAEQTKKLPIKVNSMNKAFAVMVFGLAICACQPTPEAANNTPQPVQEKPEVIVAQTPATIPPATVGLKKMDFPVYLEGVSNILHPIIPSVPLNSKSENYDSSENRSSVSYFQQISPYEFQSSVYNIVFEDINAGQTHRLFPQDNFVIKAVHAPFVDLSKVDENQKETTTTKKPTNSPKTEPSKPNTIGNEVKVDNSLLMGYFIYEVKETPKDEDNKTNLDQQLTLYMSDLSGKNLVKLTPNNQYFKSYKWLPEIKRFYFATQADTNGDRVIDENDKYYYYFIDFGKNPQMVTAYDFTKPKS